MAKQATKRPKHPRTRPRVALIGAFGEAPGARDLLAHYELPARFANLGCYAVRTGTADWLFDKHPETKLPAKVGEAGLQLLAALLDHDAVRRRLGDDVDIGFHGDLDDRALAKAFAAEGFVVEPAPISRVAAIAYAPSDPWPGVAKLLASGTPLGELLDALCIREALPPPPAKLLAALAKRITRRHELAALAMILAAARADLVAAAVPFVARCFAPPKAKARPRGLPPELATLLGVFARIPALGVLGTADLAQHHARLLRLAQGARRVGRRDWGNPPPELRIDRFWREGWIPFCQRPDDEMLAIDLDPPAKGTRGQIIGVQLNPPRLRRYRTTLGEWLWHELETAWR